MNDTIESQDIRKYLSFIAKIQAKSSRNKNWKYKSYEELVLDIGSEFYSEGTILDEYGEMGYCYKNAALRSLRTREHYCEGWAVTKELPIPLQHAWCVDENDEVMDPTWHNQPAIYIGVKLELEYVTKHLLKTGYYGIFENDWKNESEILKKGIPKKYRKV
jgi:hypothetical protein